MKKITIKVECDHDNIQIKQSRGKVLKMWCMDCGTLMGVKKEEVIKDAAYWRKHHENNPNKLGDGYI